MKNETTREYFPQVRTILKSKLNGGNIITALNSRAVSILRYGTGIIKWTKEELQTRDQKTRKLLTMYRVFNPVADVDRLHMKRSGGRRKLIDAEDCVSMEILGLKKLLFANWRKAVRGRSI